jgi:hypothetical protein
MYTHFYVVFIVIGLNTNKKEKNNNSIIVRVFFKLKLTRRQT